MRLPGYFITVLLFWSLAACAANPPRFRDEAIATLERVKSGGGEGLLPAEYQSVLQAFQKGESLLGREEAEDAERYFQLTLLKVALLEQEIHQEKARQQEAARLAEEQKQAELERRAQEEASRLARAKAEALALALAQKEAAELGRKKARPQKEYLFVLSYTVKRGESLPLIASHPEVYGDRNLWPLIYRGNRDQISDPRHIWPGQVLRIPRNVGRDDIAEARRYSQERTLH
ncbi:MAG: peptidoglycan-binding protein LysM [Geobacteraceae bacterium GWC2_58_44]|nr:MAG: peptidoglycan-binding protein LysM [Geobacteraceae bacterium GWC2_58_44]HBG06804.1 peptidoglycan-binding protein LysM [Geobacter sp.]